jgi:hypothetical protein
MADGLVAGGDEFAQPERSAAAAEYVTVRGEPILLVGGEVTCAYRFHCLGQAAGA